jgi:NADPH-dependent glutamate synthase beta subunit-like oxidoreductase/ferredoxin
MAKKNIENNTTIEIVNCPGTDKIYLPPCQIKCPLDEDIQRNHAMISKFPRDFKEAEPFIFEIGEELYKQNPLFPIICGNICGLCEEECNYKDETGAIRRRKIIWPIGKYYLNYLKNAPNFPSPTKEKVAVVGSGPGGLMCAYELSKKGYKVTIFERKEELGGALRYIPKYRLPTKTLNFMIESLIRIANIKVKTGVNISKDGKSIDELKKEGFKAVFMATGTPNPRILTVESETPEFKKIIQKLVDGDESLGIKFGLSLLYDVDRGDVAYDCYKGKKVIVVGGGNVAFDVARTARRLGGDVTLMCLECEDKSCKDGIPADVEEIEGAEEEGINIIYSRGVDGIVTENGKFKKIKTIRCECVFDEEGRFNPKFDHCDEDYLEGDILLVTIGQAPEKAVYDSFGLLNEKGRIDVDPLTLMSNRKPGIFVGGDVTKIGFASEAMREGQIAAESIHRYINGKDLKKDRKEADYEPASIPKRALYKSQPPIEWKPVQERMNFEPFEKEYKWEDVIDESIRCLYCGPCKSCKGCVALGLVDEIADIKVNEDLCSGCAVCISLCPYEAIEMIEKDDKKVISIDKTKCKRCGCCVSACPVNAITIKDTLDASIKENIKKIEVEIPK